MDTTRNLLKDFNLEEKTIDDIVIRSRKVSVSASEKVLNLETVKVKKQPEDHRHSINENSNFKSDSSDSGTPTSKPFSNNAECDSVHDGRQMLNEIYPVNIDTFMATLYSRSRIVLKFREGKKQRDLIMGDWKANEDGTKSRTVKFCQELKKALGPKTSQVTEMQVIRNCSVKGKLYSIDTMSWNEGIPYADTFYIMTHHCLVSTVDDHTMYTVFAQTKFKKPQWGLVRGLIERSVNEGLDEYYTDLQKLLQEEFCTPIAKGKRIRKINRQIGLSEDNENALTKYTGTTNKSSNSGPSQSPTKWSKFLFWFMITLLIVVTAMNSILLVKLWTLEQNSIIDSRLNEFIDFDTLNSTIRTQEDWIRILRHQEGLHQIEITKWHQILEESLRMIRDTEETLIDLLRFVILKEEKVNKRKI